MTEHFSVQTIETQLITLTTQLLIDTGIPHKHNIQLTDSIQRQLGIDSLGRAELFHRIEKHFKLTIPDVLLGEVETLQEIAQYLAAAKPTLSLHAPSAVTHAHHTTDILDMAHAQSLVEVLRLYAERAPQKPHIYFQQEEGGESVITYSEL